MKEHTYPIMFRIEQSHWWYAGRRKILRNFLEDICREVSDRRPRILDVGCGTGANLLMLSEYGDAEGVDVSEDALAFCRERGLEKVKLGAAEELPYEDGTFDLVTALDVVEHLDDDLGGLREMRRVLRPGGRVLLFAETPGHALHHHCIWDEHSKGWFTGDTFGLAYPALATPRGSHVVPATAPVQFDPVALHASVARLLASQPEVIYMTHYGEVRNPSVIAQQLLAQIDAMVTAAVALAHEPDRHAKLKAAFRNIYVTELRRCGSTLSDSEIDVWIATDVELNAQGLGVWLDRE